MVYIQVFPSPTTGALNLRNDYEEGEQQEMKADVKNYSASSFNPQTGSSVSSYFQSSSSNVTPLVNVCLWGFLSVSCRFVSILKTPFLDDLITRKIFNIIETESHRCQSIRKKRREIK